MIFWDVKFRIPNFFLHQGNQSSKHQILTQTMASKIIYVFADWIGLSGPLLMGALRVEQTRGNEVFSFEYEKKWLTSKDVVALDPDLSLYSGPQYLAGEKPNFGLFLDSSPDRWGRVLMRRREAVLARIEGRPQNTLMSSDYLPGCL